MYEQDVTVPQFIAPSEPITTPLPEPRTETPRERRVIENPEVVILAVHLRDAWKTAHAMSIAPGTWVYPRTVEEARDLNTGRVIESRRFRRNPDADRFRAAVRHLRG